MYPLQRILWAIQISFNSRDIQYQFDLTPMPIWIPSGSTYIQLETSLIQTKAQLFDVNIGEPPTPLKGL